MKLIIFLLFCVTCTHAQPRDSAMIWLDNKVMIVASAFPNIVNLRKPTFFQTNKGNKYIAVILMVPDCTKVYNIKVEATVNNTTPPTTVTEKVDGEAATFTGIWVRTSNNPGWYLNTIAFSNSPGATVSYTFTGTKIELWSERLATHGTGKISIDSGPEVNVSFNTTPFGLPVLIYSSPTLSNGSHTFRLTIVSGFCLLDYFIVQK